MNYNSLMNKPTINYRELIGDNTVTEVGGITEEQFNALLSTDLSSYYTKAQIDDLFSRSYVYREKSGSIVTFDCPASVNGIDRVVSEIVAVQSGTGDPSPTNVRPITGWSAVNVYVSGVNVWDEQWVLTGINANTGAVGTWTDRLASKNFISAKPSTSYYIKAPSTAWYPHCYDRNKNWLGRAITSNGEGYIEVQGIFTTLPNTAYIKFSAANNSYGGTYNNDISINYPSTDTGYHAYNGTTYTTALKDGQGNPLTCYGGTLTNENGVQTLDNIDGYAVFDGSSDENWISIGLGFYIEELTMQSGAYKNGLANWLKTAHSYDDESSMCITFGTQYQVIKVNHIKDNISDITDVNSWKTYLASHNLTVKYPLATPQQISQDSLSIATQEGTNNLWCDSGDITVKALDKIIQE